MISDKLPAVLTPAKPLSSISMERSLRQIKELLEGMPNNVSDSLDDRINASIDDVDVMLSCIER